MSDVQDEVFQEAVPSPSAANEALDSSIPCEGGGQVPSVPPVSEGDTVTNAEIAELLGGLDKNVRALSDRSEFYEDLVRKLQNRVESLQVDQVQQLLGPVLTRLAILVTQSADAAQLARIHGEGYRADVEFEYFHARFSRHLTSLALNPLEQHQGLHSTGLCMRLARLCGGRAGAGLDGREGTPPRPRPCGCRARIPARAGERLPLRRGPRQLG